VSHEVPDTRRKVAGLRSGILLPPPDSCCVRRDLITGAQFGRGRHNNGERRSGCLGVSQLNMLHADELRKTDTSPGDRSSDRWVEDASCECPQPLYLHCLLHRQAVDSVLSADSIDKPKSDNRNGTRSSAIADRRARRSVSAEMFFHCYYVFIFIHQTGRDKYNKILLLKMYLFKWHCHAERCRDTLHGQ